MPRVVIFSNGQLSDLEAARALLQEGDYLIAADGGARHSLALGMLPDMLVGDLDSVDENTLFKLTSARVKIEQYPKEKDETDLELALSHALRLHPASILIMGALGGRLDQTLANLSLLTDERLASIDVRLDDGVEEAFFCREQAEIWGRGGDTVSLLPWGCPVEGVMTGGLRWSLQGETLNPDRSRGVSNLMLGEAASVVIRSGLLLLVHHRL